MHERILIMGSPGSGKSTLARRMGEASGIRVVHLDAIFWQPGWREPDEEEFQDQVRRAAAGERWIMDGGYSRTLDYRLSRADLVLYLDLPRRTCIPRIVQRWLRHRNQTRPDMGRDCPEKIDLEFLRYVWNYPKDGKPRQLNRLARRPPGVELRYLRSPSEIESFLAEYSAGYSRPVGRHSMVS